MDKHLQVERSIITTFRKNIWRNFISAIKDYELINDGDVIAVCISGGKDSMLLAKCMQELQRHGKQNFQVKFLVMNPGYNDINLQNILNNASELNVPIQVFNSNIFDYVASVKDGSPCYLCARMRRGNLYAFAKEMGCNKIALGHHFNDVIETTLMSMLYNGTFKTMMPKLKSDNFAGMEVIRPLYKVKEKDIIRWKTVNELTFINCACRFTETCTIDPNDTSGSKRKEMKKIVKMLQEINPIFDDNIFTSLHNVNLNTVIGTIENGNKTLFTEGYDANDYKEE